MARIHVSIPNAALALVAATSLLVPLLSTPVSGLTPVAARTGGTASVRDPDLRSSRVLATARVRDITLRVDPQREGLGAFSHTWGDTVVFDKNSDGNPDLLLSFHVQPWEIWLGNGSGGFTFDQSLTSPDRHNCAVADFAGPAGRPRDGRPDLYCVRGAYKGTVSEKRNELLIQRAGGGFRNEVNSWGATDPSGRGRTVSILNIRGDGRPSLFVGNKAPGEHPSMDHIFANRGKRFVERRTGGLPSVQNTICSSTGDFDRDGRQDLLSCSYSLRLYRNRTTPARPVTYREVAARHGIPDGPPRDAELVHLNRDRWPDLVTVSKDALVVRLNKRQSPHFPEIDYTFPLSAGFSFCSGRANGDSEADLLVVQQLASPDDSVQQQDFMLVNSGTGHEFKVLPVPQPPVEDGRNGNGDTCSAIPGYQGKRAAWTISNGRQGTGTLHRGYRQLVILSR